MAEGPWGLAHKIPIDFGSCPGALCSLPRLAVDAVIYVYCHQSQPQFASATACSLCPRLFPVELASFSSSRLASTGFFLSDLDPSIQRLFLVINVKLPFLLLRTAKSPSCPATQPRGWGFVFARCQPARSSSSHVHPVIPAASPNLHPSLTNRGLISTFFPRLFALCSTMPPLLYFGKSRRTAYQAWL